ncbi:MAG: hypothetical protein L0H59_07020 [Tomitella sp.]|nr:hypothetical protein [Tomitella sp.]
MPAMMMAHRTANSTIGGSETKGDVGSIYSPAAHNKGRAKAPRRQVRQIEKRRWRSEIRRGLA